MANKLYDETSIQAIATAIRSKSGKTDTMTVGEMAGEINGLSGYTYDQIAEHQYTGDDLVLTCKRVFPYTFIRSQFKTVSSSTVTHFSDHQTSGMVGTSGAYTFAYCTNLESVNMPNLEQPGSGGYQFAYCTKLGTINLPSAAFIGQHMFHGCTALQTAVFDSVTYTNNNGFQDCRALQIVDFGSLVSLKSQEFYGCTKLNTIILRRSTAITSLPNVNNFTGSPFASGKAGGTIYIPKVLYDELGTGSSLDYKSATNWSTVDGYGTITWAQIEGSQYETQYADGTAIT